ncbi:MAG: hypothetical protein RX318_04180 [bacterium]|nr:hypothetical protein [bacterium]
MNNLVSKKPIAATMPAIPEFAHTLHALIPKPDDAIFKVNTASSLYALKLPIVGSNT